MLHQNLQVPSRYRIAPLVTLVEMSTSDEDNTPHSITHLELNNLVRDLEFSRAQVEIERSSLQGWKLLAPCKNI